MIRALEPTFLCILGIQGVILLLRKKCPCRVRQVQHHLMNIVTGFKQMEKLYGPKNDKMLLEPFFEKRPYMIASSFTGVMHDRLYCKQLC